MDTSQPFKWRHFQAEIILRCVRWYLRYPLSYRNLEEMMRERGLHIDHTTIYRWAQRYAPELEKGSRSHLKASNDSWRVDETYVKVKKAWMYLYRAVDSQGNTLEFLLSPRRDGEAAKRFFSKALAAPHTSTPRVITVDKNAAYPKAFKELKAERIMPDSCELRQSKYLNNLIEQDHRFMCAVSAFVRSLSKEGEVESKASRTTAYLAAKAKGNKSMHVKRAGLKGCKTTRLASPVRMVKLGLLNPSSAW
jgi:IS6 family transposase